MAHEVGDVVFYRTHPDGPGGFGFVTPNGCDPDDRTTNCWFGPVSFKHLPNYHPQRGDRITFERGKPGRNGGARVWHVHEILMSESFWDHEKITTLEGIDDVS